MPESRRLESLVTAEVADRDSRTEALLVEGLDRYFAGRYEDAIHLWTRVLFLDRQHARARAYIDRARTALAERQRRADEMLHQIGGLLADGHTARARELLRQAESAADDQYTSELRARIDRLERARAAARAGDRVTPAVSDAVPIRPWTPRSGTRLVAGLALAVGAAAVAFSVSVAFRRWLDHGAPPPSLPNVARTLPLPVPSIAEAALIRARTLYARGRLAEALQALDRVGVDNPARAEADRLRIEIQQLLLASRRGTMPIMPSSDRGQP